MSGSRLDGWRREVQALEDRCPWPGPRPLGKEPERGHLLVGREQDIERFLDWVFQRRLVLLHAKSGVGKSSLIAAGLIPKLTEEGYVPVHCSDWSGKQPGQSATEFLAAKIADQLAADGRPAAGAPTDPGALFSHLDQTYPAHFVLILDQFEELLRYNPALRAEVLAAIVELLKYRFNVVLSLRSEYKAEIEDLEAQVEPYRYGVFSLGEIEESYGRRVIESPQAENRPRVIEKTAVDRLEAAWTGACEFTAGHANPYERVGLLHLQALLYALHARTRGEVITSGDINRLIKREMLPSYEESPGEPGDGAVRDLSPTELAQLFRVALRVAIDTKLSRCRHAANVTGIDEYLVEGTFHAVVRCVRHLSSHGYKLEREIGDLAENTLREEIDSLLGALEDAERAARREGDESAETFDDRIGDELEALLSAVTATVGRGENSGLALLDSPRTDFALDADAGVADRWTDRLLHDDPACASAGPMFGQAPAATLIEELRRFAFGVLWLVETDIVRITTHGDRKRMVSLIHDGFGDALVRWSKDHQHAPERALHAITALRGADFDWEEHTISGTPDTPRVIANLRWQGAWVTARFEHVMFVNCDLRGVGFAACPFRGVTFVNCWMDGAMFLKCSVGGAVSASPDALQRALDEPRFQIRADESLLGSFDAYPERQRDGLAALVTGRTQEPAVPVVAAELGGAAALTASEGGIVIHGGRCSSLGFRATSGHVALRQVAGSGLDVSDGSGRFEFDACNLRHVRFVAPAGSTTLEISARETAVAQLWIGPDVTGRLFVSGGIVAQAWNEESERLQATITGGARVHGTVGFAVGDVEALEPDESLKTIRATGIEDEQLNAASLVMDLAADIATRAGRARD